MAGEEAKILKNIEKELRELNEPEKPASWFWHGIIQGAGWVVGTLLCIFLLGYILNIFGVIPGVGEIAHNLQVILDRNQR